jgi:hypothetical protein
MGANTAALEGSSRSLPEPGVRRYAVAHKIEGGYGRSIHIYSDKQIQKPDKAVGG